MSSAYPIHACVTTAHLFHTSVWMVYHHLNNEFSSVLFMQIFKFFETLSKETRKGNLPQWDSNPMPLICQMSALTARPQRIPNLSQITYPSDSYVWPLNCHKQYYLQIIICISHPCMCYHCASVLCICPDGLPSSK